MSIQLNEFKGMENASTESAWNPHGTRVESAENPRGIRVESASDPHATTRMESAQNPRLTRGAGRETPTT